MQAERVGREGELVQVVDSRSIIILYYKTEADRALYISDLETVTNSHLRSRPCTSHQTGRRRAQLAPW